MEFLKKAEAVIANDHFVFKAGYMHGNLYVDKNKFLYMGARNLVALIDEMVDSAVISGLKFGRVKEVGVVAPAYGAIPFALPVAKALEIYFPDIKFFPARTQLKKDENGRDVHYLPEKLIKDYRGKLFVGIEDIVNNGTTVREIKSLFKEKADAEVVAFLSFVNRAGQTAESLGIADFYPYMNPKLEQFDVREAPCPLCAAGRPLNTELGKGAEWVKMFGQPPYPGDMDFSAFWVKTG